MYSLYYICHLLIHHQASWCYKKKRAGEKPRVMSFEKKAVLPRLQKSPKSRHNYNQSSSSFSFYISFPLFCPRIPETAVGCYSFFSLLSATTFPSQGDSHYFPSIPFIPPTTTTTAAAKKEKLKSNNLVSTYFFAVIHFFSAKKRHARIYLFRTPKDAKKEKGGGGRRKGKGISFFLSSIYFLLPDRWVVNEIDLLFFSLYHSNCRPIVMIVIGAHRV